MPVYELYVNEETNEFEVRDESCSKSKDPSNTLKLIDRLDADITIKEAYKRYYLAYPQRKVVIADCCKRK